MRPHSNHPEQLGEFQPLQMPLRLQEGLSLHEGVAHHIAQSMAGPDQPGDGAVPSDFVSERSVGASRWAAP